MELTLKSREDFTALYGTHEYCEEECAIANEMQDADVDGIVVLQEYALKNDCTFTWKVSASKRLRNLSINFLNVIQKVYSFQKMKIR